MCTACFGLTLLSNYDKVAYDFNFNDLDGSSLSLSDYKEKVIVVADIGLRENFLIYIALIFSNSQHYPKVLFHPKI